MSWQAVDWVMKNSPVRGADRLVLLVLANHADRDSWECYPSIETIAEQARLSRKRTVQECLERLEKGGHIARSINGAQDTSTAKFDPRYRPNLYRVLRPRAAAEGCRDTASVGVTPNGTARGDASRRSGVTFHAPRGDVSRPLGVTFHAARGDVSRQLGVTKNDTLIVIEPSEEPSIEQSGEPSLEQSGKNADAAEAETNPLGACIKAWEYATGQGVTHQIADAIMHELDDGAPVEDVLYAIEQTGLAGKAAWRYTRAILRDKRDKRDGRAAHAHTPPPEMSAPRGVERPAPDANAWADVLSELSALPAYRLQHLDTMRPLRVVGDCLVVEAAHAATLNRDNLLQRAILRAVNVRLGGDLAALWFEQSEAVA